MKVISGLLTLAAVLLSVHAGDDEDGGLKTLGPCVGRVDGRIVNLAPLSRTDGHPRFQLEYDGWNYTYNPCHSFNLPVSDPYMAHGDKCVYVMVCKSRDGGEGRYGTYHPLGIQDNARFIYIRAGQGSHSSESDEWSSEENGGISSSEEYGWYSSEEGGKMGEDFNSAEDEAGGMELPRRNFNLDQDESPNTRQNATDLSSSRGQLALQLKGWGSQRGKKTFIILRCDITRISPDDASFTLKTIIGRKYTYFELGHICACPGACVDGKIADSYNNGIFGYSAEEGTDEASTKDMLTMVGINLGVLSSAFIIAAICCRRGKTTHSGPVAGGGYYSHLPGIHGSQFTIHSVDSYYPPMSIMSTPRGSISKLDKSLTKLDYLPSKSSTPKSLRHSPAAPADPQPQLDLEIIPSQELIVAQRLGGGLYSDTYQATLKTEKVAAKRITVGVHESTINGNDYDWVLKEVAHLRNQHHKSLVTVLGLCEGSRQPYVITEFVDGESLKDVLLKQDGSKSLSWREKIKLLIQAAEGMSFLHSATPQILHRDLRCANLLVNIRGELKVVDFGMTKIVQRLRMRCSGRKGCYCQKEMSAFPASIRWTAPEVLQHPQTNDKNGMTSSCDIYSFSMVMWEVAETGDPFEEIKSETDVGEIIKSGGRPRLDTVRGWPPQYKELMATCWDQQPTNRPTFRQVSGHLKATLQLMENDTTSIQMIAKTTGLPKPNSSITSYLKTTLKVQE